MTSAEPFLFPVHENGLSQWENKDALYSGILILRVNSETAFFSVKSSLNRNEGNLISFSNLYDLNLYYPKQVHYHLIFHL